MRINKIVSNQSLFNKAKNLGLAIVATTALTSCVPENVKTAFQDKPKEDYYTFVNDCKIKGLTYYQMQEKLDTTFYKEFLRSSELAQNKNAIDEFENIAKNNSVSVNEPENKKFEEHNILKEKYQKLIKDSEYYGYATLESHTDYSILQYKLDSIVYRSFFEKYGILTPEKIKEFEDISQKISPVNNKF